MASHPVAPFALTAPAKINLALSVGPPGADGFHSLATLFQALAFGDTVELARAEDSHWERTWAADAPRPSPIDWPLERDLAHRAHAALEARVGRPLPTRVRLLKRVPTGAGLGGGSADAAAMLAGLNRLHGLGLDWQADLLPLAAGLGSDCAFAFAALAGQPLALGTGRGERLQPLTQPPPFGWFAIAFPAAHCPTPAVYAAFDRLGRFGSADIAACLAVAAGTVQPFNDLEAAAARVSPEVGHLLARWRAEGFQALLCGSGACVAVPCADRDEATAAADVIRFNFDCPTRVVEGMGNIP